MGCNDGDVGQMLNARLESFIASTCMALAEIEVLALKCIRVSCLNNLAMQIGTYESFLECAFGCFTQAQCHLAHPSSGT